MHRPLWRGHFPNGRPASHSLRPTSRQGFGHQSSGGPRGYGEWREEQKVVETGPNTFDLQGTFTIRGVSTPETLKLTITGKGTSSGTIEGTMAFDRKEYGMNSGIPFIKIADRVEVTVNLKGKRVSGPRVTFKQ